MDSNHHLCSGCSLVDFRIPSEWITTVRDTAAKKSNIVSSGHDDDSFATGSIVETKDGSSSNDQGLIASQATRTHMSSPILISSDHHTHNAAAAAADEHSIHPHHDIINITDQLHVSEEEGATDPCIGSAPRQIHLAVGKNASNSMTISFAVPLECHPSNYTAAVVYWKDEGSAIDRHHRVHLRSSTMDDIRQYNSTATYHPKWEYKSPYLHHLRLTGLEPAMRYCYACVIHDANEDFDYSSYVEDFCNNSTPTSTSALSFRTAPSLTTERGLFPYKFAVLGDSGGGKRAMKAFNLISQNRADLIVNMGDVAYVEGIGEKWDHFFQRQEAVFSSIPVMPVPGNHDVEPTAVTREIFHHYEHRFAMPQIKDAIRKRGEKNVPHNPKNWHAYMTMETLFIVLFLGRWLSSI